MRRMILGLSLKVVENGLFDGIEVLTEDKITEKVCDGVRRKI